MQELRRSKHAHVARPLAATVCAVLLRMLASAIRRAGDLLARLLRHVSRDANVVSPSTSPVVVLPVHHEPSPIQPGPPNSSFLTLKDSKGRGLQLGMRARPRRATIQRPRREGRHAQGKHHRSRLQRPRDAAQVRRQHPGAGVPRLRAYPRRRRQHGRLARPLRRVRREGQPCARAPQGKLRGLGHAQQGA